MNKNKKIDRKPVVPGVQRRGFSCRIDGIILKHAENACRKKYKMGLSSKIEDFLINEFPELKKFVK